MTTTQTWWKVTEELSRGFGVMYHDVAPVEIERATDSSVWIDGRRHQLGTAYASYFPTLEAAIQFVDARCVLEVERAEKKLYQAKDRKAHWDALRDRLVAEHGGQQ